MDALILVDVQNDFCPGGALAVSEGDRIVPILNDYIRIFEARRLPIVASRDWHPATTRHFRDYGGAWPIHCVQETRGAEFHPGLGLPKGVILATKGDDPNIDAYSAFQGTTPTGLSLGEALRARGVDHVFVGGLATDYCVKATVLDALLAGFGATLLADAALGVNLQAHDSEEAVAEMTLAGAKLATLQTVKPTLTAGPTP